MSFEAYGRLERWQSTAGEGPQLRGRRSEAGSGPRIHFLHGNGFCGGVYWPMLEAILPGYRLFTHDLEGHGESDAPAHYSGTGALIRRIPQVIEQQQLGTGLIGIGHSFGGALTLAAAARNAGMFRALVLLDPILLPPPLWWWFRNSDRIGQNPMSNAARRRRERWASREEASQRLRGRGIYAGWSAEAHESFIEYATRDADGGRVLCCPRDLEAAIFASPVYPWKALPKIDVPVLMLRGAQSYPFFAWTERLIRRRHPQVRLQQLPGGHCFMQQDPAAAAQAVRGFLAEHAAAEKA